MARLWVRAFEIWSRAHTVTLSVQRPVSELLSWYKRFGIVIRVIFANVSFYIYLVNNITKLLGLLQYLVPFIVLFFTTFFVALFGPVISLLFSQFWFLNTWFAVADRYVANCFLVLQHAHWFVDSFVCLFSFLHICMLYFYCLVPFISLLVLSLVGTAYVGAAHISCRMNPVV